MKFKILGGAAAAGLLLAFLIYWSMSSLVSCLVCLLLGFLKKNWRVFFFSFALAAVLPLMLVTCTLFGTVPAGAIDNLIGIFYTYWFLTVIIACFCLFGLVAYKTKTWKMMGGFFLGLCFFIYLLPIVIILLMF
ncbi:MAG: Hypothetical protein BHV28_00260 [Candidatus Tokpelaia hoelldobleri]|uniref:Uncharacterized protein n=1 Tax=Candidatus Tokpelaia hoelldobleri TaxID=1902579 RepID=A0A1U9JSB8_9HYPH|nr:MAG: Hypothetical protein BHV28_00260 [Candidatus Tokpelaia hoelldoblerii]